MVKTALYIFTWVNIKLGVILSAIMCLRKISNSLKWYLKEMQYVHVFLNKYCTSNNGNDKVVLKGIA